MVGILKALVIAILGGLLAGHWVRNGWLALLLMIGLVGTETTYEAVHRHWRPVRDVEAFALLDTAGSAALLIGEVLSI